MTDHFIGVDVGTGSVRVGVFGQFGQPLATSKHDIAMHTEPGGIAEQSSTQVWNAVCAATRSAVANAAIDPGTVRGIGFDATCSMVVLCANGKSLPVGDLAHPKRDIIVWMDHRAVEQAARINAGEHHVLMYVGGRISPEMQTPKLLWLKENRPETYAAAGSFFDLTDFLGWKATGSLSRSSCTVTCKWTYLAHERRWDPDYFHAIGLGDLVEDNFARIGQEIVRPGTKLGQGLTKAAASELGLSPGTAVAAGLIDAHAGGIATVGARGGAEDPTSCLGYVFGTSSCTMTTTAEPTFVPGVWGPYYSAMIPGAWLCEGGQSAAGAAIDQLVSLHPACSEAAAFAKAEGKPLPVWLADTALAHAATASDVVALATGLHVVPEFLGNRAPFSDPMARAVIAGLGMENDIRSLQALYVAGICSLGYGLRQIVEIKNRNGAPVSSIAVSGGAGQHPLVRQLLADATGLRVEATRCDEPVLLGSAILGAVAAGSFADINAAMPMMSEIGQSYTPAAGTLRQVHDDRFDAFLKLQTVARDIRNTGDHQPQSRV
ncbi:FGGY-family carbohydrate kinase [Roseinatronobacter sp. S2]|uniref:FGGY-family carbohydrate kinase n=1 Tax=Roseinatronobacter sp. S2 TaxID=3035471 RepID=UPI00240FBC79|nr:FGGY-family carbohydrate kinase [Roseinatronobacter sp. S2]WFE75852.1 FGGY-family carbohydrate kinase [Roseinatronobacter sp. S2]